MFFNGLSVTLMTRIATEADSCIDKFVIVPIFVLTDNHNISVVGMDFQTFLI